MGLEALGTDHPGIVLGGYRLDRVVGTEPSFHVLYDATALDTGDQVAVKVYATVAHGRAARRFLRAGRTRSGLNKHPHLLAFLGAGELDGQLFGALETCSAPTLADLLLRGPGEPEQVISVLRDVASGLDAGAAAGIFDNTLSPETIQVDRTRGALLGDFGISLLLSEDSSPWAHPHARQLSPEAARGESIEQRSNVYSLACILFECLAGSPPFRGEVASLVYAHAANEPPRASERDPNLPIAIDAVLARGLAKDLEERFGSSGELIDAAAAALGVREESSPAVKQRRRVRGIGRSHRGANGHGQRRTNGRGHRGANGGAPRRKNGGAPTPANGTAPAPANDGTPATANGRTHRAANGGAPAVANGGAPAVANGGAPAVPERQPLPPVQVEAPVQVPAPAQVTAPVQVPAPERPEAPRRPRIRLSSFAIPAALAVVAVAAGYSFGGSSAPTEAPSARTISAASLSLDLPVGWRARPAETALPGVDISDGVAAGPRGDREAAIVAWQPKTVYANLLPAGLVADGRGTPVRVGDLEAVRMRTRGSSPMTVYSVPTTTGAVIVACTLPPAGPAAECDQAASTLQLRGAESTSLDEAAAAPRRLSAAIATLDRRRLDGRARIVSARSPRGQRAAAASLRNAYRAAASSLGAQPAAGADLKLALGQAAAQYRRLGRAAYAGRAKRFRAARRGVRAAEARVDRALAPLVRRD